MLISNLILNIETHAEKLASDYVADLVSNPQTCQIARMPNEDLERVARDLYVRLSSWLGEKHVEEFEAEFRARAHRQHAAGLPLGEIVAAVLLLKKHVWQFVVRNVMVDSIGDLYQRDEVIVLIAEFFDRLLYSTAKGYEEAREHWADPKLMA